MTRRIANDNYKKSGTSFQDLLTPAQIKDKLKDYVRTDIEDIPIHTHVRYFAVNPKTKQPQFRIGGTITKKFKDYVVLSNGQLTWSVQKKTSIFFKKMEYEEIKTEVEDDVLQKYQKKINDLKNENLELKNTLKELKVKVKNELNKK